MDSTESFIPLGKMSDLLMYFGDHFTVYTCSLADILDTYKKELILASIFTVVVGTNDSRHT